MKIIENQTFDEERALYGSHALTVRSCAFDGPSDGESALKECTDITAEHCFFNLRYPFWHVHGLKIIGTQPLCCCKNLNLINCEMIGCDLAFEKSEVTAEITTPVVSIKNPRSGSIVLPSVGMIIRDDPDSQGEIICTDTNAPKKATLSAKI